VNPEAERHAQDEAEVVSLVFAARTDAKLEKSYEDAQGLLLQFLTHRLGSQAEAQDVAQAAFLKLWQRRDELNGENLRALLFVTARNLAADIIRSRRRGHLAMLQSNDSDHHDIPDATPSPERVLVGRSEMMLVRRLIAELPGKCRHAFTAYKFDGLSYGEIAVQMGITESMVRKYVRRALVHCTSRYAQREGWE
jgi:RNA polymerase sigma-70 factor (ECF subfamily)